MARIKARAYRRMKHAVIDIGTNTCLLLIAESGTVGTMTVIEDIHAIARLGAGIDETRRIQNESYLRLKKILLEHHRIILEDNVNGTTVIGTSALRDAENRNEIIFQIKRNCGFETEILSGKDESLWSYRGALCGLPKSGLQGSIATLDIGGGSTELSIGKNGKYLHGNSANIGAVRITERFLSERTHHALESANDFI